jgi:glycosyltransferase involved in cell wall biosynthesis
VTGVLYIVASFKSGGTETQLLEILRRLDRRRFRPFVLTFRREGGLLPLFENLGVEIFESRFDSLISARAARCFRDLGRWIDERSIRVLHGFHFHGSLYGALIKVMRPRVKLVICEQGLSGPAGWHIAAGRRFVYLTADVILVNCEAVRRVLVERDGLDPGTVSIIYGGVDTEKFLYRDSRVRANGSGPVVGCVGRLHPDKGQVVLARAASRIAESLPGVRILLAGDGPQRPEVERILDEEGARDHVDLLGDHRDIPHLLAELDLLVLPSMNEGFANAALEGMSTGLPVVVSDAGGNPEVVDHQVTGLVFRRGDPEALASAVVRICKDPELARSMGRAGRERVTSIFGVDHLVRRHEEMYSDLVSGGPLKRGWDQGQRQGEGESA